MASMEFKLAAGIISGATAAVFASAAMPLCALGFGVASGIFLARALFESNRAQYVLGAGGGLAGFLVGGAKMMAQAAQNAPVM